MNTMLSVSKDEVTGFVHDWFRKLDDHADVTDVVPMLSASTFYMKVPEAEIKSIAEFETWYQGVVCKFFDEQHTMKELTIDLASNGTQADVKFCVNWETRAWSPPAARSKHIMLDAYQTWAVRRSSTSQRLVIASYVIDKVELKQGSATL